MLIIFVALIISPARAFAQVIPTENITPSPIYSPQQIDYPLPYPGILPDKPFFFIKEFRDKIWEITTLNPYKKTEFYLMQADKKLSSALVLFNSDTKCSEKTAASSLDYLEKAINQEAIAKNSPGNLLELSQKIIQSSIKQTEMIEGLYRNSNGDFKVKFEKDLNRAKNLKKLAEEFRPQL